MPEDTKEEQAAVQLDSPVPSTNSVFNEEIDIFDVNSFVEKWFFDNIANSPATQGPMQITNQLILAKENLKERLLSQKLKFLT